MRVDPQQVCSASDILYDGRYCIGVVAREGESVCHDFFMPESYKLAIKSRDIQNALVDERERINAYSPNLVIGLTSTADDTYA